eukprot:TRINITY_DN48309_c0_g1_i1.p2 TRINITY_DN48309_c0_g1~~TRINITY_DN48309_c0_g1_i1.p2  ORF type:complete len:154 (+),score=16.76 TRINITY_DN48309_c0_g1_i1:35-463(+)
MDCPKDGWHFKGEGVTAFRTFEWDLRLWNAEKKFEYSYCTVMKEVRGMLVRRGEYEVADNRVFCNVESKVRITKNNGPPSVSPDPVKGHEQIVFDIVADGSLTSDEPTPLGEKLVLFPTEESQLSITLTEAQHPPSSVKEIE